MDFWMVGGSPHTPKPLRLALSDYFRQSMYQGIKLTLDAKQQNGRAVDTYALVRHFCNVKSLLEIEEAIARLPAKARRQFVKDIPALCPDEFPPDGWDAILKEEKPRPALSAFLDKLDADYQENPDSFLMLNDKTLRSKK
jgi:hypothetical protein